MLVIRRKPSEGIALLNGVIVIRVLGVKGDVVKLGIHAPSDVTIVRQEHLEDYYSDNHLAGNHRQSAHLAPRLPAHDTSTHRHDVQANCSDALPE